MSISLLSCSNINHTLTEFSINRSCDIQKFDEVLVFSDVPLLGLRHKHTYLDIAQTISPRNAETNEPVALSLDVYNDFLFKHLVNWVNTDHVLSIHYDGFGVNVDEWSDEFLEYDYIGSPTHKKWYPLANTLKTHKLYDSLPNQWYTGGGGFSLRSKKLLQALQDPGLSVFISDLNLQRCEDWNIAVKYKDYLVKEHGIKFAPLDISLKFSTEILYGVNFSFGFHGWENVPLFLSESDTVFFLSNLNKDTVNRHNLITRRFMANCIVQGYDRALKLLDHVLDEKEKSRAETYSR
jgi:hypothetical protein